MRLSLGSCLECATQDRKTTRVAPLHQLRRPQMRLSLVPHLEHPTQDRKATQVGSLHQLRLSQMRLLLLPYTVCNFQSMKSPVELNSLFSKFFCYITWFVYHLTRCDNERLANEAFTSNPIVSSKQ